MSKVQVNISLTQTAHAAACREAGRLGITKSAWIARQIMTKFNEPPPISYGTPGAGRVGHSTAVTLPPDVRTQIIALADRDCRSTSGMLAKLVAEALEARRKLAHDHSIR